MTTRFHVLIPCQSFVTCSTEQPEPDSWKIENDLKIVTDLLATEDAKIFEAGPLESGTAVYNLDRDLALWVEGGVVYAVNERARDAAPGLSISPGNITYADVYEATCDGDVARKMRPAFIAMKGSELSVDEVAKCEKHLDACPKDIWLRTILLGYYGKQRFASKENIKRKEQHVLWLAKNVPGNAAVSSPDAFLDKYINPEAYIEVACVLKDHVNKEPENLRLLANAADYFQLHDTDYAIDCLTKCTAIAPDNPYWHKELGFTLWLRARRSGVIATADIAFGKEALSEMEKSWELTMNPSTKVGILRDMASISFENGDMEKARKYATDLLKGIDAADDWERNNCIHTGNTVLGRIALKNGDREMAKEYLIASAQHDGSPQLNSFGPEMTLAQDLLEMGEKATVIEYLEFCGRFWRKHITDEWGKQIRDGKTPKLDRQLACQFSQ